MNVPDCRQEERGKFRRNGVVADGDHGDHGTRVERKNVSVQPAESKRTVGGKRKEEGVWNGEKKRGVSEREGTD